MLGVLATLLLGAGWASADSKSTGGDTATEAPVQVTVQEVTPGTGAVASYGNDVINPESEGISWNNNYEAAPNRWWGGAEYLLWNVRDTSLPRLTTAIPAGLATVALNDGTGATALVPVSVLSNPGVPNSNQLNLGDHSGARFTLGAWLDDEGTFGVEGSFFFLEERSLGFASTSGTALNQFIVDTQIVIPTQNNGNLNVAFPTQSNSTLTGTMRTQVYGGELNAVVGGLQIGAFSFRGITGFRALQLEEQLNVQNDIRLTPINTGNVTQFPVPAANGTPFVQFNTLDDIHVWNRFYGGNVGADVYADFGGWFVSARGQVAVGANVQKVRVRGFTSVSANGIPQQSVTSGVLSGVFDQGGARSRTRVGVVPEVIVKLGYQFSDWLRIFAHYDAFYVKDAVRPGNIVAVDTSNTQITVNGTTNTFTVQQPSIVLNEVDTWIRGIGFGAELFW